MLNHPRLICCSRRLGLGNPDGGCRCAWRGIACVAQRCRRPDCCRTARGRGAFQIVLERGTSEAPGSVLFITASWKRSLRIVQAERGGHIAEYRLGRRDRGSAIFAAQRRDFGSRAAPARQRRRPLPHTQPWSGSGGESTGERGGECRHRGGVVPDMRVVTRLRCISAPTSIMPRLHSATRKKLHPSNRHTQRRCRWRSARSRFGGRSMGWLRTDAGPGRVGEDAVHRDRPPADLPGDVTVKILRRDDGDLVAGGLGWRGGRKGQVSGLSASDRY